MLRRRTRRYASTTRWARSGPSAAYSSVILMCVVPQPTGNGGGRGGRKGAVLRVRHPRQHVGVLLRRVVRDRACLPPLPRRLAACGRGLRGLLLHLPGAAVQPRVRIYLILDYYMTT